MKTTQQYAEELAEFLCQLSRSIPSEIEYKTSAIVNNYQDIFDRFCPFQIGDEVILTKEVDFAKAPNWKPSKHFLVNGAIAVVKSRDFKHGLFVFGVEFEDDSWIDTDEIIHKYEPENRHLFYIDESYLRLKMIS